MFVYQVYHPLRFRAKIHLSFSAYLSIFTCARQRKTGVVIVNMPQQHTDTGGIQGGLRM
jgi:hypothetical protein